MNLRRFGLTFLALVTPACGDPSEADDVDITTFLTSIPRLSFEETNTDHEGYRQFLIEYEQPSDHTDPTGPTFLQHLTLLHRDRSAPMNLLTNGYGGTTSPGLYEVTTLTNANQIVVEQRFFNRSRPSPTNWDNLTVEQAATDHHRIIEALRPYYGEAWIATGASKGGMTSIYHRRFFPDDVDGVVAYVAPNSHGPEDTRYFDFIDELGSDACREALHAFQRRTLLERRDGVIAYLEAHGEDNGYTYDLLGLDGALETAVTEAPFYLWQYFDESVCDIIPDDTASDEEHFQFLLDYALIYGNSDSRLAYFQPYYYQAATQLGYPEIDHSPVEDLLIAPYDLDVLLPPGTPPVTFDTLAMPDIQDWIATQGSELMLIYGENDPWTAGAFELGQARDSYLYIVPNGNHGSSIQLLPEEQRSEAYDVLARWTNTPIQFRSFSTATSETPLDPNLIPPKARAQAR